MAPVKAIVLVLCACSSQVDNGGDWEPVESVTGVLAPEIGPAPASHEVPSTLRVVSWNVHFGDDIAGLAARVLASTEIARGDVFLIQETEAYPTEPTSRTRRLAEALGMTWVYAPAREKDGGTHGIALLSHFPIEHAEVRKLPHFESTFNERARNAMRAEIVVGARRIEVVNVHLDVRLGAVDRVRQLDPAIAELDEVTIVGGDFNTNPWAWVQSTVPLTGTEAIVGMEQAVVIDDYLAAQGLPAAISPDTATMRLPAFQIRTDALYVRGYVMTGSGVEHVDGSDHWPIWVDVVLD